MYTSKEYSITHKGVWSFEYIPIPNYFNNKTL